MYGRSAEWTLLSFIFRWSSHVFGVFGRNDNTDFLSRDFVLFSYARGGRYQAIRSSRKLYWKRCSMGDSLLDVCEWDSLISYIVQREGICSEISVFWTVYKTIFFVGGEGGVLHGRLEGESVCDSFYSGNMVWVSPLLYQALDAIDDMMLGSQGQKSSHKQACVGFLTF